MFNIALSLLLLSVLVEAKMLQRTKVLMGTFVTLSLNAQDKHHFKPSFKLLKSIEASLSSYDLNATVYRLNRDKIVKADFYTYDAMRLAKEYYRVSDGYFNIAIGSVTKNLYHFGEDEQIPSLNALQKSRVLFKGIYFDKDILKIDKNIKIDFGGMGKGYGVDRVTEYLKQHHILNATIALSGDIRCLGACSIDIQDPFSQGIVVSLKSIADEMAFSTSGSYNRYVETQEHNHLINPKTKESQQNFLSITLISKLPNSDLDAFATAASVMPIQMAYHFLNKKNLAYIIMEKNSHMFVSENIELFVTYTKK